jgi:UDP-hydrolysing UDP-N-acetyl-D-glucosamine 2-epimerase
MNTIVSGAHLDPHFGGTADEICADGFLVDETPEIATASGSVIGICTAMGIGLIRYGDVLDRLRPHLLVLLGDRYEVFTMAAAATVNRIPIAHINGGEAAEGVIDEPFRHSVTKMSHLHFTSCETHRNRVIQLGEDPNRVFNVGALGVENAQTLQVPDEREIRSYLGFEPGRPYLLCTFHPETLSETLPITQIETILAALESFPDYAVVFTGANADAGGVEINAAIQACVARNPRYRFFMSLGQKRYFAAVRHAACVLGNSSSGIIEVPSFHVPVIDIGDRQRSRVRAEFVLHATNDLDSICQILDYALSTEYRASFARAANPYDRPGTAQRIVDILSSWPLHGILHKHFYDNVRL